MWSLACCLAPTLALLLLSPHFSTPCLFISFKSSWIFPLLPSAGGTLFLSLVLVTFSSFFSLVLATPYLVWLLYLSYLPCSLWTIILSDYPQGHSQKPSCTQKYSTGSCIFFLILLEYSWFTMLFSSIQHSEPVIHTYIHIYIHTHTYLHSFFLRFFPPCRSLQSIE